MKGVLGLKMSRAWGCLVKRYNTALVSDKERGILLMAVSCKERLKTALPGCGMVSAGESSATPFIQLCRGRKRRQNLGRDTEILPEKAWIFSPVLSKANLLTSCCGEGNCSVY